MEGPYAADVKHGWWTVRASDGEVAEGPYVEGWQHGSWTIRSVDGRCEAWEYRRGELVERAPC